VPKSENQNDGTDGKLSITECEATIREDTSMGICTQGGDLVPVYKKYVETPYIKIYQIYIWIICIRLTDRVL